MTKAAKKLMLTWPVTYHYYIVYQDATGIGACDFCRADPIKTFADVRSIGRNIQSRNKLKLEPVIINWILL